MRYQLPKDFYWGASTSAHQVEGGNINDWSEWEKKNAERLAKESEAHFGKLPSWERTRSEAERADNYISGVATDHYDHYEKDFDLARELGHNAHRFSIEWSRVEPKEGEFNEDALEHYRMVLNALKSRNIEPFVTIWHWTLPLWLRDKGGILAHQFPKLFRRYAERLAREYPEIRFWITINEPEIISLNSYLRGIWPPQIRSVYYFYKSLWHLIYAHRITYKRIKEINSKANVGVSVNIISFEASDFFGRITKWFMDHLYNFHFLGHVHKELDFIGLNHYFRNKIKGFRFNQNENEKISDLGWELYPEAILPVLRDLKAYKLPIYITEHGLADHEDKYRTGFIKETLKNVAYAMQDNCDVRGYLHWSLLDNFEWDKGFWPRFGLIAVDYETQKRIIRQSAREFAKIIAANSIEME